MDGEPRERRLAAILAMDVAGYSRRAEQDEAAAVRLVSRLGELARAAAAANGGRVFNTAGDGFMLEFPAAASALEAAETLTREAAALEPPAQVRIGLHLGDVWPAAGGDLLGHGVNVAARLQALAAPGGVLTSGEFAHAVRGPAAARLRPQGAARLDKMDDVVRLFALAGGPARRRPRLSAPWAVGLAAGLVVALAAGWVGWRLLGAAPVDSEPRFAVQPLQAPPGDAEAGAVARAAADDLREALGRSQLLVAADPATPGTADLVLSGSVERSGGELSVRLRLERAADKVALWSNAFTRPTAEAASLRTRAAAEGADVARWAADAWRKGEGPRSGLLRWLHKDGSRIDAAAYAELVQGNASLSLGGAANAVRGRAMFQKAIERAPRFGTAWSALAIGDGLAARTVPPAEAAALIAEAKASTQKALALDPRDGQALLALSLTLPPTDWSGQEAYLLRAVSIDPRFPYAHNRLSYMLGDEGRMADAMVEARKGLALDSLHPGAIYKLAMLQAQGGDYPAARATLDQAVQLWPMPWLRQSRLALAMLYGPSADGRALLDEMRAQPLANEGPLLDAWAAFDAARRSPAARPRARQALLDATHQGLRVTEAILALIMLGDLDDAFALFPRASSPNGDSIADVFYAPAAAPLRQDPRFWAEAARQGLTKYWRTSGHWPDICTATQALDCRRRAAG